MRPSAFTGSSVRPSPPPLDNAPFSVPYNATASDGHLWIAPVGRSDLRTKLKIKGANWAGFQAGGCPHILWQRNGVTPPISTVDDYVNFLVTNRFNAVRLPVSALPAPQDGGSLAWVLDARRDGPA